MKRLSHLILGVLFFFSFCSTEKHKLKTRTESGNTYQYVTNDPNKTRIYTLDNGLKVYLSQNRDSPRAQVSIAVKAGGKNDPKDNTGLAHYLEHMMFKGTSHFGTVDYPSEKILLDSIELLFGQYAKLTDTLERQKHYQKIDDLSYRASGYAIANEYDKLISSIGGQYLNAYTTQDRTVYIVDVPSNELNRLIEIEGLRFREIINRLFHTELETVYEEKNRSLDNDNWKIYEAINTLLFEKHPYGTQTVIGTVEHLKNPSITQINHYFDTYYKPNNTAICISGDIDFIQVIDLIEEHFGDWKPNPDIPQWEMIEEAPITSPREIQVIGPDAERVDIAFRFDGYGSDDYLKLVLMDMLLSNGEAGFIDLNLIQAQKVLNASCYISEANDYSVHRLYGQPKEGQTLHEVKELLLGEIEKIKAGKFEPWLMEAVINDLKKSEMQNEENTDFANYYRADQMVMAFTTSTPWNEVVSSYDRLSAITKDELVAFANQHYGENYAVVYKKTGTDPNIQKVVKPTITKVQTNTESQSSFFEQLLTKKVEKTQPVYVDFESELDFYQTNSIPIIAKQNNNNDLFELTYLFEFGKNSHLHLSMIHNDLLTILGTDEYTPEEIQKKFYRLGSSYSISSSPKGDRTYMTLRGLNEHLEESIKLFEHLLQHAIGQQKDLDLLIERILKSRNDAKKNKNAVFSRLRNYATYGPHNPQTDLLSENELKELTMHQLTDILKNLCHYPHRILYYGSSSQSELTQLINTYHSTTNQLQINSEPKPYPEKNYDTSQVFWTHFDMVQSEINLLARLEPFDPMKSPYIELYNETFSALVFQEIREAQGLAYAVSSYYNQGNRKGLYDYLQSYVGIQSDKQSEALSSMFHLIDTPLSSEIGFEVAKKAVLNQIESQRISNSEVLDSYIRHQDLGLTTDRRKLIYQEVRNMSFQDLIDFQEKYTSNKQHNITLIGHRENIHFENLAQYGTVTELNLEQLFGY
ncbi:MAG: insulinase family protein [Flavobacteriaceae bacterium]|nr:insulinase family protein [Flavobacteriaceae bacterium]